MRSQTLTSGPFLAAILVALALSVVWAATSPIDDPYSIVNAQWNGTSKLTPEGFHPISSDFAKTLGSTSSPGLLLIVGPSRQFERADADAIRALVVSGGVLMLSDNFGSGNGLLELLGIPVRFDGRVLIDTLFYNRQPTFPRVFDLAQSRFTSGVDELVLNYGTALNITSYSGVTRLAVSSPFSFLDSNKDGKKDPGEPAGPLPVLAMVKIGGGTVVLFSSPLSITNGLISEAGNNVLIADAINAASQPIRSTSILLDETHLQPSPFTPTKLVMQDFLSQVLMGGMSLFGKLLLTGVAVGFVAVRYVHRKPEGGVSIDKDKIPVAEPLGEVDSVAQLHPTWDRRVLVYVASELEAARRWMD